MSSPHPSMEPRAVGRGGSTTDGTLARHGRLRASRPAVAIAKFIAAALAVLLVSSASVAAFAVWNVTSAIAPGVALPGEEDVPAPAVGTIEGPVDLLLVGSDSGEGDPAYGKRGERLNDVTMLMHISADHTRATVVSFPRDLEVDIPECTGPDGQEYPPLNNVKINNALSRGGLACPVATVEQLTGIDIPWAAKIEFNGVTAMADVVGGVEVCVATAIHDRQISFDLEAGQQTLSGRNAQLFLRSRYGVGDGSDLGRINNQQLFLSALVRKLKDANTLSNPVTLYGIASVASQNLEFTNSLRNVNTMVAIASALKDIPLEDVVFLKYPGEASGPNVIGDEDAAAEMFAAIKADIPVVITGGTGKGTVEANPEPGAPTDPAAPVDPSTSADPGAPVDPSATPSPTAVELPDSIEGQNASQQTCTAGQTAGGR